MAGTKRVSWSAIDGYHLVEVPLREARIDANGLQLGPASPRDWQLSWDEKQLPQQDVSGNAMDGP